MQVEVFCRNKKRQDLIEKLALFLANELNLVRSKKELTIYTVTDYRKKMGFTGSTVKPNNNSIAILIDSRLGYEKMVLTLAHEMVHVKQFALGQLRPEKYGSNTGYWFWKGRRMGNDYVMSPWEDEAYKKEGCLAEHAKKWLRLLP